MSWKARTNGLQAITVLWIVRGNEFRDMMPGRRRIAETSESNEQVATSCGCSSSDICVADLMTQCMTTLCWARVQGTRETTESGTEILTCLLYFDLSVRNATIRSTEVISVVITELQINTTVSNLVISCSDSCSDDCTRDRIGLFTVLARINQY